MFCENRFEIPRLFADHRSTFFSENDKIVNSTLEEFLKFVNPILLLGPWIFLLLDIFEP